MNTIDCVWFGERKAAVTDYSRHRFLAETWEDGFDSRRWDEEDRSMRSEFTVYPLNELGKEAATLLSGMFSTFLDDIETICGKDGREMALARTHLEDAKMRAVRALATRDQYRETGLPHGDS